MKKLARKASQEWHRLKAYFSGCLAVIVLLAVAGFFSLSFIATLFGIRNQQPASQKRVDARMEFQDSPVLAGALAYMKVRLLNSDGTSYLDVAPSDGRYFHVFITSEDFRFFGHDHPDEYVRTIPASFAHGEFTLPVVFPEAGVYSVAVRFTNSQSGEIIKLFSVNVSDQNGALPATNPHIEQDARKTKRFNGYTVSISPGPRTILPCVATRLSYAIEKDGHQVTALESIEASPKGPALALAAWDESLRTFLYAQATASAGAVPVANMLFPRAGGYHLFAEFKHNGEVVPTSFFVPVTGSRECGQ